MKIEDLLISDLRLDPNNARKHNAKNIQTIKHSLQQYGQQKNIVVDSEYTVIAGNGTVIAAKELGWTKLTANITDLKGSDLIAFGLVDNRSAELAEWDDDVLKSLLEGLKAEDFDLSAIGFEIDDVNNIIGNENKTGLTDPDEVPEPPKVPTTKLGDIWRLGNHRLMCGDSTSKEQVERLMDGQKADMVFTDPPYNVEYTGGIQFKNGQAITDNREMIKNDNVDIYPQALKILSDFCDGACYIWFAGTKAARLYAAAERYGEIHALIIWVKNGGYGALNASYKQKHEPCLFWKPKGKKLDFIGDTTETTIWEINKDGINKLHPTQKPVELAFKAISNHAAKSVLDLFGGSGSTLIACEKTGRRCFMMELDPKYCDVIIKRWEDFTGKKAVLVSEN